MQAVGVLPRRPSTSHTARSGKGSSRERAKPASKEILPWDWSGARSWAPMCERAHQHQVVLASSAPRPEEPRRPSPDSGGNARRRVEASESGASYANFGSTVLPASRSTYRSAEGPRAERIAQHGVPKVVCGRGGLSAEVAPKRRCWSSVERRASVHVHHVTMHVTGLGGTGSFSARVNPELKPLAPGPTIRY